MTTKTLYYGGNYLFKSTDRGDSWERLGPDLTTGVDRDKLPILGKVPDKNTLSRHDGVQQFPCATTVAESPVKAGVLWVGTDDGNLQVTRDDGKTWTNVAGNVPGVKKGAYVAKVEPSYHDVGTAYVAFDNHRSDDFSVYIYVTPDFGRTWKSIGKGIPEEAGSAHVIREDPTNPNLLFAGTEFGMFISFDRGSSWEKMRNGLPTVPVFDIHVHPREHDLIVGTHGRSIWVMDDITPLEELSDNVTSSAVDLFSMRPGVEFHMANMKGFTGQREFIAPNPPYGVLVDYYLKAKLDGRNPVRITVTDKAGNHIRELNGPAEAGINRADWDLRYDAPVRPQGQAGAGGARGGGGGGRGAAAQAAAQAAGTGPGGAAPGGANPAQVAPVEGGTAEAGGQAGAGAEAAAGAGGGAGGGGGGGGGGGFFGGGNRGPLVDPGEYTITIAAAGKTISKPVTVEQDPRITMSPEVMAARRQAITKLYGMTREADAGRRKIVALRTSLTNLTESWKRPGAPQVPDPVKKEADGMLARVKEVIGTFEVEREGGLGNAGPPLKYIPPPVNQRITRLMNSIDSFSAAPTARQLADIDTASTELQEGLAAVKKLTDDDLPRLNKMMAEAGVPYVTIDVNAAPPAGPRGGENQ